MGKIGRNDVCPCGSGKNLSAVVLANSRVQTANLTEVQKAQISLQNGINAIQEAASKGIQKVHELGVFVFFSTTGGDAWLLEVSEMDGLQVAAGKEILPVDLEENPETIEISWTHTFEIKNKQFITTAYKDKKVEKVDDYPTHPILAAIKRIKKKYSPELLESVHIGQERLDGEA